MILDPMLATGGSAALALQRLRDAGVHHAVLVVIIAAPEGVRRVLSEHRDVRIFASAIDSCLDRHGMIHPGVGDAGDRINGTSSATNS